MSNTDTAHARSIPWDCSDWQAAAAVDDAEDARVSVILESLATNRGKTLYCAVDQSDTFTKAETWEAGKDRNERDDTVYYGENGRFRGFLSAQEGYLTDGESGVTGISRDRIFEFPEEERRRVKRTVRRSVGPHDDRRIESDWGPNPTSACRPSVDRDDCESKARNAYAGNPPAVEWDTLAQTAATAYCEGAGYRKATSVAASTAPSELGWKYREHPTWRNNLAPTQRLYNAKTTNTWSAVCVKTVRKRR